VRHKFEGIKGKTIEWTDGGGHGMFEVGEKKYYNQGNGKVVLEDDQVLVRNMTVRFF